MTDQKADPQKTEQVKNRNKTIPKQHSDMKDLEERVEFHRHGLAILPSPEDKKPGIAFFIKDNDDEMGDRFCTCTIYRKKTCHHILDLVRVFKALSEKFEDNSPDKDFRSGVWFRIASILGDGSNAKLKDVTIKTIRTEKLHITLFSDSKDMELIRYFSFNSDLTRIIERCTELPGKGRNYIPNRNSLIKKLGYLTLKKGERLLLEKGFKTRGQSIEESFWFTLAYHGYREFENDRFTLHPAVDKKTGLFTVTCRDLLNNPVFRMTIPRDKVKRLLAALDKFLPNQHNMSVHPVPLKSIFNVDINTELDLEVRPLIKLIQKDGEEKFFNREDLKRFQYGDLVYIPELGIMAQLEPPGSERRFKAPVKMVLKKAQIPDFLDEYGDEIFDEENIISPEIRAVKIIREYDRIEIKPGTLDRDWCWLSVEYVFGSESLPLQEILRARKEGLKYLPTGSGWIDTQSSQFKMLDNFFKDAADENDKEQLKFSRLDIFRLKALGGESMHFQNMNNESSDLLNRIIELKPSRPFPETSGLKSELRIYQKLGAEWLAFLYENRLGGLLCDDMGLGKTHQVMAFLLYLREQLNVIKPFIVVCPTTVLSHWKEKIDNHAPSLNAVVHHGGDRDLKDSLVNGSMIVTSYGVLLRDIEDLNKIPFSVAVFDEIQHIKNPDTRAYRASGILGADIKIGLTGTPIENRLDELKALLDITVPGYLDSDKKFSEKYSHPIEILNDNESKKELGRLISPFMLRRLKRSVLSELPDKIEDVLGCSLSNDQIRLYKSAIALRGKGLIDTLVKGKGPIPYIHIFALLNLLKQICDHPALAEKVPEKYEEFESGKWELFKEILEESLGSDQKVVIYSQYLGMIRIMEHYFRKQEISYVSLTGSSRNRGDILKQFREDPDCRVFVGSLKAGGVGIDLISASVVIHYDRWWNAAKEDQATDRVHRIGQTRGVQVFKLITQGTLEEKIAAIIAKKKDLMDSVVKEDDPGILKGFSKEDLMELMNF